MVDAISFFNCLENCPLCKTQLRGIFIGAESRIESITPSSYEERFVIERYVKKSKYIFFSERDNSKTIDLRTYEPLNISVVNLYCQHKDGNNVLEHYSLLPERECFFLKKEEACFTISCSRDNIIISTYADNGEHEREFAGDFYLRFKSRFEIENFIKKASLL